VFVVQVSTLDVRKLSVLISRWRVGVKSRLSDDLRSHVLVESRVSSNVLIVVFRDSLAGLFLALKLVRVAESLGLWVTMYKAEVVSDVEALIDSELRKRLDKIPPELIHPVKKALKEGKLPRGKLREEVIKAMKS